MDNQPKATSAPASDSPAEQQLAEFVANNRQHLPQLPQRLQVLVAEPSPEVVAQYAAREAKAAEHAELRHRADLHQRAAELLNAAGQRYRDCTLENFACKVPIQRQVVSSVVAYVAADCPENLILYGPVGTGKDHLAFAVCRSAVKAGKTVRWVNGQSWFGTVRDSFDSVKSEASLISELSRPDLLCLSDPLPPMGALTQFQSTMLYRLIDARYSRNVPTICTVNVANDGEADERIGAATWDRLCHGAYKLRCPWPSYRQPSREV